MRFFFSLILLCFFAQTATSQTNDAVLWTGLGLKYDVTKNIGIKYESQVRIFKNISTISTYYNEFSGDYKINKRFDIGMRYRHSFRNQEPNYTQDNRIAIDLSHDDKDKDLGLKIKTRARYQLDFDRLRVINSNIYPNIRNTFRLKSELSYENDAFKRLNPFFGGEIFVPLSDPQSDFISGYRIFAGIEIDLPARHEIDLKYIFQREKGSPFENTHIYMIQYNYELKFKKND